MPRKPSKAKLDPKYDPYPIIERIMKYLNRALDGVEPLTEVCNEIPRYFMTYRIREVVRKLNDKVYRYEYFELCVDQCVTLCDPVLRVRITEENKAFIEKVKEIIHLWNAITTLCRGVHMVRTYGLELLHRKNGR